MARPINGSINRLQIDPELLGKNKEGKPVYLYFSVWENDAPDKFGNTHVIKQTGDKSTGYKKGKIIGNCKFPDDAPPQRQSAPTARKPAPHQDPDLDESGDDFDF